MSTLIFDFGVRLLDALELTRILRCLPAVCGKSLSECGGAPPPLKQC
jgi:hypothetical protein